MSFSAAIASLTVTGLDGGSTPGDTEQMTLTAYDAAGNLIGQNHFTTEFADGAIMGSISAAGARHVAFNYTNTDFGFYGIDDLSFEFAAPTPDGGDTAILLGWTVGGLLFIRRRKSAA